VAQISVVILSGRSLFTEGLASRLREHTEQFIVQHVDSRYDDALDRVIASRPSTIILDTTDEDSNRRLMGAMVDALPSVKIIRVDPQQPYVQVVTSEQRQAADVRHLIALIAETVEHSID
jgi:DNA-binding NarL/FixJ family response regulator